MTEVQSNKKEASPFRRSMRKLGIWSLVVIIAGWFIYYFICGMSYSEGTRSGILTKVSKKGYLFKTYEGELNIGGISQGDGTIMPASVFHFSVEDEKAYAELESAQGKKVVLHYKEVIHSFFWQGDSDYFVYKISEVK